MMDASHLKRHVPTLMGYWERRRQARKNQLPKFLRPLSRWPILWQMAVNVGIISTLTYLIVNQDDFVSEAGPAIGLVICVLLLIYTLIEGFELKNRYKKTPRYRLAVVNFWLMWIAAVMIPVSVVTFLP